MNTPEEHALMWDSHTRAVELRRRVDEGLGTAPCRPPEPPKQTVHTGYAPAGLSCEVRVCTMGPWAESLYISMELLDKSRVRDMMTYEMSKIFRRLAIVNAVIKEDRDF